MNTKYILFFILGIILFPACKKKTVVVEEPQIISKDTISRENSYKPTGKKEIYDAELEAFVLEDEVSPFEGPLDQAINDEDDAAIMFVEEKPGKEGGRIIAPFKTIYFDYDSAVLRPDQKISLEHNLTIARELTKKGHTIVIKGHSCTITRSRLHNIHVSEMRAKVIKQYFVEHGVSAHSLKIVGHGCEMPKIPFGDKAQQAPNRRAEFAMM